MPDFVYGGTHRYMDDRCLRGGDSAWRYEDGTAATLEIMRHTKAALADISLMNREARLRAEIRKTRYPVTCAASANEAGRPAEPKTGRQNLRLCRRFCLMQYGCNTIKTACYRSRWRGDVCHA